MKFFHLLLVVLLAIVELSHSYTESPVGECCEEYCYGTDSDRPQSSHYATKTAYQIVRGLDSSRYYDVPNCNPKKFWLLGRHGTRLPSAQNMQKLKGLIDLRDQIIDNYEKRRSKPETGALCDADYQSIKYWKWDSNITGDHDQFLTVQGWNDYKFMAKHYQRILPNILENIYTPDKYLFRFTKTQRTEASYKAFVEGLFGDNAYEHIQTPQAFENDTLIKQHNNCPPWVEKKQIILTSPTSEMNKFVNTEIYQEMLNEVSVRLGFRFQLTDAQVGQIWDMCRFEQAWFLERLSPWCAAFTKKHINILEYKEDLKYYYKSGYGSEINKKISCSTVADMLKHLDSPNEPRAVAYFAHSATLHLMLTALGALHDGQPLRADNYNQMERRKWKTSAIGPFSANLVAIKYECPSDLERHKVMFFLNEKPLDFDWCKVGLCDWNVIQEKYKEFTTGDCASIFCGHSSGTISKISFVLVFIQTIVLASRNFF